MARLESEGPHTPEVRTILDFIRSSSRGVILKRRGRAAAEEDEDDE